MKTAILPTMSEKPKSLKGFAKVLDVARANEMEAMSKRWEKEETHHTISKMPDEQRAHLMRKAVMPKAFGKLGKLD